MSSFTEAGLRKTRLARWRTVLHFNHCS